MLRSPQTFGAIARVGPVAGAGPAGAGAARATLSARGYLAVAQATEMAVTETLELQDGLRAAARPRARRGRRQRHCCRGASPRRSCGGSRSLMAARPQRRACRRRPRSARAGGRAASLGRARRARRPRPRALPAQPGRPPAPARLRGARRPVRVRRASWTCARSSRSDRRAARAQAEPDRLGPEARGPCARRCRAGWAPR